VTDWHLAGDAVVYLRQSSGAQVRENIGSAMHQRSQVETLQAMGFPLSRIRVIDEDLGQTGTSTKNRAGWESMVDGILAETVRVVAVSEVSRLGRDAVELVKFLALCEWKRVLLLENGVPRDLREVGDWTLVQIQAVLAQQENRRRTLRVQSGRLAKARTRLPAIPLPCGFERGPNGEAVKTSDAAVREVLERIWRDALQGRTGSEITRGLRADGLRVPGRVRQGRTAMLPPTRAAIYRILSNPIYAGHLVIWKYRTELRPEGKRVRRARPEEQEVLPGKIEAYVTPEEYQQVRDLVAARQLPARSWVGEGAALAPGLVRCAAHGQRLYVAYKSPPGRPAKPSGCHYYICRGASAEAGLQPLCMTVSGRMLDRAIDEIVLHELRCPAVSALRQAIHEENERRQAERRRLAGEAQRATAAVDAARTRLDESRQRGRNPHVTEMYEDELEHAIVLARQAERRLTMSPAPALLDASPAFLERLVAVFRELPRLWHSGVLGPRERKEVVRRVIAHIDILEKGETTRVRVTLHGDRVVERVLLGCVARRRLIEALDAEGWEPAAIVADLARRGLVNERGRPYTVETVSNLLYAWKGPERGICRSRTRQAVVEAFQALWRAGLPQAEIAGRLNAQGFRTGQRRSWTVDAVAHVAERLGLPSRGAITREALRAPLTELVAAGQDDAAIAEILNARGLQTYSKKPWNASRVKRVRRQLWIRRRPGRQTPVARTPAAEETAP